MPESAAQDQERQNKVMGRGLSTLQKLGCLSRLLPTRPAEVWERLATMAEVRAETYRRRAPAVEPVEWSRVVSDVSQFCQVDVNSILRETELKDVEDEVLLLQQTLPMDAPFGTFHNGDIQLARLCYALARIIQPRAIVETGVCYGVTSAFLLQALQVNGSGILHSIDLPPLGRNADHFVGTVVPAGLRHNWTLHRGSSRSLLPSVLQSLRQVDLFVHDSLHTYRNMRREFETIQPCLSPTAAVVADDIEGNEAFRQWSDRAGPQYSVTLREQSKTSLVGVALFRR
jgi:hypothetical protein